MEKIALVTILLLVPALLIFLERKVKLIQFFGSIGFCYFTGFILSFLKLELFQDQLVKDLTEVFLIFSLPLLLVNTNLKILFKSTPEILKAFGISVITVITAVTIMTYTLHDKIANIEQVAASVTALFTGGTVNLSSLVMALGIEENLFIVINTCDFLVGAIYLFLIINLCQIKKTAPTEKEQISYEAYYGKKTLSFLGYTLVLNGLVLGTSYFLFKSLNGTFIILSLTVLSIVACNLIDFKEVPKGEKLGEYFLMLFCLFIALQFDFNKIASIGPIIIVYFVSVLAINNIIYTLFTRLFKIQFAQALIAHMASIFGPPFVILACTNMNRNDLMAPGIAVGILGIVIGTFLGISIHGILS
ncbi:MAG: DUF819 family protein [Halobacteriovoraceae bacterium]|nr:DUF819 family protein [Halobacteriovoraceae bacterium]MCB9094118.1 DUF819 family protein [Halobacteriovoraceae bacterium]